MSITIQVKPRRFVVEMDEGEVYNLVLNLNQARVPITSSTENLRRRLQEELGYEPIEDIM